MKNGPQYSTLAARPGLVTELEQYTRDGDQDLRRAAAALIRTAEPQIRDSVVAALTLPRAAGWQRVADCEAIAGARADAVLKRLLADRQLNGDLRIAAGEVLAAMTERRLFLRGSAAPPPRADELLRAASASSNTPNDKLLRASDDGTSPSSESSMTSAALDVPRADTMRITEVSDAPSAEREPAWRAWWRRVIG